MAKDDSNEIVKSREFFGLYPNQPYGPSAHIFTNMPRETKRPIVGRTYVEVEFYRTNQQGYHVFETRTVFIPRYPIEPIVDLETFIMYLAGAPLEKASTVLSGFTKPHVKPIEQSVEKVTEIYKGKKEDYVQHKIDEFEKKINDPLLWAYDANGSSVRLGVIDDEVLKTALFKARFGRLETMDDINWYLGGRIFDARYFAFHPSHIGCKKGPLDKLAVVKEVTMMQPYTINQIPVIIPSPSMHLIAEVSDEGEAKALVHESLEKEKLDAKEGLAERLNKENLPRHIWPGDRITFSFIWVYRTFIQEMWKFEKNIMEKRKDLPESPLLITSAEIISMPK